jgi:hypothetical protein
LQNQAFSCIIGIRDVYPLPDAIKLQAMMDAGFESCSIPINIFLAIREIESWFLAEENHYNLINALLTVSQINRLVGFDITKLTTENIPHPSLILK